MRNEWPNNLILSTSSVARYSLSSWFSCNWHLLSVTSLTGARSWLFLSTQVMIHNHQLLTLQQLCMRKTETSTVCGSYQYSSTRKSILTFRESLKIPSTQTNEAKVKIPLILMILIWACNESLRCKVRWHRIKNSKTQNDDIEAYQSQKTSSRRESLPWKCGQR